MISLKPLTPDDWRDWRALRQEALREASYAFGSSLADRQDAGETEERWRSRLRNVDFKCSCAPGWRFCWNGERHVGRRSPGAHLDVGCSLLRGAVASAMLS